MRCQVVYTEGNELGLQRDRVSVTIEEMLTD